MILLRMGLRSQIRGGKGDICAIIRQLAVLRKSMRNALWLARQKDTVDATYTKR